MESRGTFGGAGILDYVFVTYHFATQHFGASPSTARGSVAPPALHKKYGPALRAGVGGVLVFLADILAGTVAYQDQWVGRWVFPAWLVSAQHEIRAGATIILLAATAAMLFVELRSPRWSLPRLLYVLGIAAMVALALRQRSLFPFLVIWTSQHWILATGIASQTPIAEPAPVRGIGRRLFHALNTRPWAILVLLVVGFGHALAAFEVEAIGQDGTYYGDRIFGAVATGLRTSLWVPALLALGFATGFIHYLLDRSVYRMSSPQVRAAARGLLAGTGKPGRGA